MAPSESSFLISLRDQPSSKIVWKKEKENYNYDSSYKFLLRTFFHDRSNHGIGGDIFFFFTIIIIIIVCVQVASGAGVFVILVGGGLEINCPSS